MNFPKAASVSTGRVSRVSSGRCLLEIQGKTGNDVEARDPEKDHENYAD
jgi:hypothetical protein